MPRQLVSKVLQRTEWRRRVCFPHRDSSIVTQRTTTRSISRSTRALSPYIKDDSLRRRRFIPEPTWSLQDLELNAQHAKLPKEEVRRLAKLSLLDFVDNDHSSAMEDEDREALEQDLANMMHMVQQVSEFTQAHPELFASVDSDRHGEEESAARIYDMVRGVETAPLRTGGRNDKGYMDPLQELDQTQADQVWSTYLEPNTIRKGGAHQYFAISTKEGEGGTKD